MTPLLRLLLTLLLALGLNARASDKIDAPADGASHPVIQPHVTAELIPEVTTIEGGKPFGVALHLHMDPGWHTYWINPGDAGLATMIKWTLPPGFTAGPIQWPTPERHSMGPLMTYGYDDDVYLLTTITPPPGDLPEHFDLNARATWLVCQDECIPGKAELTLTLDSGLLNFRLPVENTKLFAQIRARLPVENTRWGVSAYYDAKALNLTLHESGKPADKSLILRFFPDANNVLSNLDQDQGPTAVAPDGTTIALSPALQQNGERPAKLSGVLLSDSPLIGEAKAVHIDEFPIADSAGAATVVPPEAAGSTDTIAAAANPATPPVTAPAPPVTSAAPTVAAPVQPLLIAVLFWAFLGGLILNLMPCVLPVLSLKVFSLIKHAGDNSKAAWLQGVAFTGGVLVSFWALGGVLLALRAAGSKLGWGFQMQSPGFVAALILLFFLIALNLFGVFEIGTSLVGLDAKAAKHTGGTTSSFLNGALATLAATPCTAPFMGSALGFAAQQPAIVSLLVFTCLALGMAAPYLLLTIFPQALRLVPKPGAWMEALKQFMGFLLLGTVIFLLYVFGALLETNAIFEMLAILLVVSIAAWIYGRGAVPTNSALQRFLSLAAALLILLASAGATAAVINAPATTGANKPTAAADGWQDWSPSAVDAALASGQPVFVDFTAAWCLSCKVNERVALDTDAVKSAFVQKNVVLFRADWTHSDPRISDTLQQFHRDGVPLYLLYSPKAKDTPQVLPEVLTPGIVLDALGKL